MIGIVTIAVRETITNAMLTKKPKEIAPSTSACQIRFAQQADDRVGQRHRAQRELLALVYIVLDEDAAPPGSQGLQRKAGLITTSHDITISSAQDTRNATNTHIPRDDRSK